MSDPYTLKIHVLNGDPEGVRIIDRMNWTGQGIVFPRADWPSIKSRESFARPGIYILAGYDADDRAFFLKVRDVVEAAVSEATFRQVAQKLQKTRDIRLTGDPVKSVEVLANRYTLNDTERTGVLRHLIVEGDLSAYGLVNAVTNFSQDVEDYDRATEFEVLGGKLIELAPADWKEVVHAA
jgi:hypothetical protein